MPSRSLLSIQIQIIILRCVGRCLLPECNKTWQDCSYSFFNNVKQLIKVLLANIQTISILLMTINKNLVVKGKNPENKVKI